MSQPLVSIIIPTTYDRASFNERILKMANAQDYPNKEILFNFEPKIIGVKRNDLCRQANGAYIAHFDSDDKYAPDWISKSMQAIQDTDSDIVGLSSLYFYEEESGQAWMYKWVTPSYPWVAGATFVYKKELWERKPFPEIQTSEDQGFLFRTRKIMDHGYVNGFVASIHPVNTSRREVGSPNYKRCSEEEERGIRERFFGAEVQRSI